MGQGASFCFDIQAVSVQPTPADDPPKRVKKRAAACEPGQPPLRIVIADDKADNRALLMNMLEPLGFELREAQNGREVVDIWKQWRPDLIWMDIRMPVMDGYQAARKIRAQQGPSENQTSVIIGVTANIFEQDETLALEAGCDDFLRKPFRESEIFDLMEKHLQVRFVYEEKTHEIRNKCASSPDEAASMPRALSNLPHELRQALRKAADTLDINAARQVIDQIRPHSNTLANQCADLVEAFQFDQLSKHL